MNFKYTYLFLLLLLFSTGVITPTTIASASTQTCTQEIKTLDSDGGYWVETITTPTPASLFATYTLGNIVQKTSTKTTKYYNANDELCWKYSLTAQFRVNQGLYATCMDSSAKLSIYKSGYTLSDEEHSHSGNKATGKIKIKHNGVTKSKTISITCSKNGTIS